MYIPYYIHYTIYYIFIYIIFNVYTVSHRSEYTPHIFVNILLYLFSDNTEEITLCYNVK